MSPQYIMRLMRTPLDEMTAEEAAFITAYLAAYSEAFGPLV